MNVVLIVLAAYILALGILAGISAGLRRQQRSRERREHDNDIKGPPNE